MGVESLGNAVSLLRREALTPASFRTLEREVRRRGRFSRSLMLLFGVAAGGRSELLLAHRRQTDIAESPQVSRLSKAAVSGYVSSGGRG